jgi:hypothetical protein
MRKQELAFAADAAATANPGSGATVVATNVVPLPPGYIRKNKARFVGYSTPEGTIESFLWAIANRDTNGILRSLTDEIGEDVKQGLRSESRTHEFFKKADLLPGLLVRDKEEGQGGEVKVQVEILPNMPAQTLELKLENGEWKIATHF